VLRIAHEHTSAPIGFEDQKAILQRTSPAWAHWIACHLTLRSTWRAATGSAGLRPRV